MERFWRIAALRGAVVALAAATCLCSAEGAAGSFSTSAQPTPPALSDVGQSASAWHEGDGAAIISSAPLGTTFSFKLNVRAHVTFTFVPKFSGRRVCTFHDTPGGVTRTCRRVVAVSTLSFDGHAGVNHMRFFGRLSPVAKLTPARYRLSISARNRIGAAAPATLRFTILP
jgi:hypothetical protein